MPIEMIDVADMTEAEGQPSAQSNAGSDDTTTGGAAGGEAQKAPTAAEPSSGEGNTAEAATGTAAEGSATVMPTKIKIAGEEVDEEIAARAIKDYRNEQAWKDKLARKGEELNRQLALAARLIEQHTPTPTPERDFEAELQAHYQAMPDPYADKAEMATWNLKRDKLWAEKQAFDSQRAMSAGAAERESHAYHSQLAADAREKYVVKGSVSDDEFQQMVEFVLENAKPGKDGKLNRNVFDYAYRIVHAGKYEAEIRLDAARKAVTPLANAKKGDGSEPGVSTHSTAPKTDADLQDEAFINSVRRSRKGQWETL